MPDSTDSTDVPPIPPTSLDDEEARPPEERSMSSFVDRQMVEARILLLVGPVTDKMAKECTTRLLVMERLDPEAAITVYINTPGGSADSGFAIYDLLRFIKPPVKTVVNGLCASAGILIHLAGDEGQRYCLPESRFMIHQPSTAGHGTASDLDITAREVMKLRQRYSKIIADATGRKPDEIVADAQRDFWLNSEEALEYRLVDQIVSKRSELE